MARKRLKCIYCVAVKIVWEDLRPNRSFPHFKLETGEMLPLIIGPGKDISLSQEEIELVANKCFPEGVTCKSLLPREFLNRFQDHMIMEVFALTEERDFSDYPPLMDLTGNMDSVSVKI